jgi:hypothetical protein
MDEKFQQKFFSYWKLSNLQYKNDEDSKRHAPSHQSNAPMLFELLIVSISGCAPDGKK